MIVIELICRMVLWVLFNLVWWVALTAFFMLLAIPVIAVVSLFQKGNFSDRFKVLFNATLAKWKEWGSMIAPTPDI